MTQALSHAVVRRFVVVGLVVAAAVAAVTVTRSTQPTSESTPIPGVAAPSAGSRDEAAPDPTGPAQSRSSPPAISADESPAPLVGGTLPDDAASLRALVAGFPEVIPLAGKSTVVASSVSTSGNRLQATLDATTELPPSSVTDFYLSTFAALALTGTSTQSTGSSTGTVFTRGSDSVTLTVSPEGAGSRYSLLGVLDVAP